MVNYADAVNRAVRSEHYLGAIIEKIDDLLGFPQGAVPTGAAFIVEGQGVFCHAPIIRERDIDIKGKKR